MPDQRKLILFILAIALAGAALRVFGIQEQPLFSDEIHMAYTAKGYMERGHSIPAMPHHPNLRNILIFLSIKIFGVNGLGLRFFSLLFGILCIPLLGLILYKLSGNVNSAALAAFMLAVDPLHITMSRDAIQETHVLFFVLLGIYTFLLWLRSYEKDQGNKGKDLILLLATGLAFGLATASKYQAGFPLAVCFVLAVFKAFRARDFSMVFLVMLVFTILPLMMLLFSDTPWFSRGYGLDDWIFMRRALMERMSSKFIPPVMETNPDRTALEWFIKPLLGYAGFTVSGGKTFLSVGMGNPLVWLLALPSSVYLMFKKRDTNNGIIQALFWSSYLPFVLAPRPIFFLSALAVAPFAFCMVSVAVSDILGTTRKKLLYLYIGLVFAISLLMFPLCRGKSLDYKYTTILTERFSPH